MAVLYSITGSFKNLARERKEFVSMAKDTAVRVFVLYTGGTIGMKTKKGGRGDEMLTAKELLRGIRYPKNITITTQTLTDRVTGKELTQDSTNITYDDRVRMAEIIRDAYQTHDAFVVLHGTDSLPETCAAFCMIFKASLAVPIFVVGAQMRKEEVGSDVKIQIENTFRVAKSFAQMGLGGIYNVCMSDVWDGCRLVKRADSDILAFYTPGRPPVAKIWPRIYSRSIVRLGQKNPEWLERWLGRWLGRKDYRTLLRFDPYFERQVATLKVSADTPPRLLVDAVQAGSLKGVILECKGAGNLPNRRWDADFPYSWIDAIKETTKAGVPIGITSPFEDGRVIFQRYELGEKAEEAGAISLETLTPPMADAKFRHFVGWPGMLEKNSRGRFETLQTVMCIDFVGELMRYAEEHDGKPVFGVGREVQSKLKLLSKTFSVPLNLLEYKDIRGLLRLVKLLSPILHDPPNFLSLRLPVRKNI